MSPGDDDHDLGIGAIERNGTSDAAHGPDGTDAVSGSGETEAITSASAPDALADSSAVSAAGDAGAIDSTGDVQGIDEISADLAAGAISPAQAQARLIEQVVASQLPEGADPVTLDAVREEVTALLADDPLIAALLDPRR